MATVGRKQKGLVNSVGDWGMNAIIAMGDFALFAGRTFGWALRRKPIASNLLSSFYDIGVRSVPVVAVTGLFIGMVMAVQMYNQFNRIGLATRLGSMINITIVRELGPVLAATMLAGRVGSSMAAELATMRITEQVDAMACLGAHPLHHLVVPRLFASTLLVPTLTILADFMGVIGGAVICLKIFGVESHYYWEHTKDYVAAWDVAVGLIKATFFGAAICLIACHRGLNSKPGAEGVGRAATEAFVASFVVILVLDFFLALFLNSFYAVLLPEELRRSFI